jgi:hypothetical protein
MDGRIQMLLNRVQNVNLTKNIMHGYSETLSKKKPIFESSF